MSILTPIGDAIWRRLEPLIDKHLTALRADAKAEFAQLRGEALTMLSEALPEMSGEIAEKTVATVFRHTQVDEATNAVAGTVEHIVNGLRERLRFPFLTPGQQ